LLTAAAVTAVAVLAAPARALVALEDGRDHIFVDGSFEMGYDSNVFANAESGGSVSYRETLAIAFSRHAGLIGVNATASLEAGQYSSFRGQNYVDPKVTAELTKLTGRTTGTLSASIQREDHADVTTNTRDTSWVYDTGLNFQYPVIERYSISGTVDYNKTDYLDQTLFTNLVTYTEDVYLYYILNEQRDLFVDYRNRYTEEESGVTDSDNDLSGGVSGKVYGPFNGSVQFGYQQRSTRGGPEAGDVFNDVSANGATTWNIDRRMTLTANLSRDFSTTATAQSIDTSSAGLVFQDSLTAKASTTLTAEGGQNRFLGAEGDVQPGGAQRVDWFYELGAAYFYTVNQHLKFSISYDYYRSYSTLAYAEFGRHQVDFTVSSHW
jgi:hypothetical protein